MIIEVHDGLVWEYDEIVEVSLVDSMAIANKMPGLVFAEHFVKKYNGQTLYLDEYLKIIPSKRSTFRISDFIPRLKRGERIKGIHA